MGTRLILARHGETFASVDRRFAGSTDVDLTDNGHEQAKALGRRLRAMRIDAIYVSPLRRCLDTAAPVSETTGLRLRVTDEIRECSFGTWENMTATEVMSYDAGGFQQWIASDEYTPPDGESWAHVRERMLAWWAEVSEKHADRTVLAVTHGGTILSMLRHYLGSPYQSLFTLEIDPASITVLQTRGHMMRVRTVNDTSHYRDLLSSTQAPDEVPL